MISIQIVFGIIAIILTSVALVKSRNIKNHLNEIIKLTEQSATEYKPRKKAS